VSKYEGVYSAPNTNENQKHINNNNNNINNNTRLIVLIV
jgi:hypothetical protein